MEFSITTDIERIAEGLRLPPELVRRVVELLDGGYSVAFLARYRRGLVGYLDEDALFRVRAVVTEARQLNDRKQTILKAITHQNALTPEVEQAVREAADTRRLEDVYLPFKRRKRGRGDLPLGETERQLFASVLDPAGIVDLDAARASLHPVSAVSEGAAESGADPLEQGLGHWMLQQPDLRMHVRSVLERHATIVAGKFVEPSPDATDLESVPDSEQAPSYSAEERSDSGPMEISEGASPELPGHDESWIEDAHSVDDDGEHAEDHESEPTATTATATETMSSSESDSAVVKGEAPKQPGGSPDSLAQQRRAQRREARRKRRGRLESIFRGYFRFRRPLSKISPCDLLALDRGERVRILELHYEVPLEKVFQECLPSICPPDHPRRDLLVDSFRSGLRNEHSTLVRELQRDLCERAEQRRLQGQRAKLRRILMRRPTTEGVLAIEPQIRRESTLVALDPAGKLLAHRMLHLTLDETQREIAATEMGSLLAAHHLRWVVLGDGPGCRDVLQVLMRIQDSLPEENRFALAVVRAAGTGLWARGG
ncbi:MAG TPA: Tex-like N-terminal domain-containing protein, partial [Pirellulaceae bacterium]